MLFIITGCAPLGFLVLFDAVGQVLVKPKIFENNNESRISAAKFEEVCKLCVSALFSKYVCIQLLLMPHQAVYMPV